MEESFPEKIFVGFGVELRQVGMTAERQPDVFFVQQPRPRLRLKIQELNYFQYRTNLTKVIGKTLT
jgi:hypothetical protein